MSLKKPPTSTTSKKWPIYLGLMVFLVIIMMMIRALMPPKTYRVLNDYKPWDEVVKQELELIPVQDGGRIKPLQAYANYTLLKLYGAKTIKIEKQGETIKIDATAWLLDVITRPEIADELPSFRVDNGELLESLGLEIKKQRDRYSYNELYAVQAKLFELAQLYQKNQGDEKLPLLEKQTVALARAMESYTVLRNYFDFARESYKLPLPGDDGKTEIKEFALSSILTLMPQIHQSIIEYGEKNPNQLPPNIEPMLNQITSQANSAKFELMLFSAESGEQTWRPMGDLIWDAAQLKGENWMSKVIHVASAEQLYKGIRYFSQNAWIEENPVPVEAVESSEISGLKKDSSNEELIKAWNNQQEALKAITDWKELHYERMDNQSATQSKRLQLEHTFTSQNFLYLSLIFFIIAFIFTIFSWLQPASLVGRLLRQGQSLLVLSSIILATIAIIQRCLIMERPPVGNLYDTIPFITICAVLFAFLLELLFKKMRPNSYFYGLSALIGLLGMFLARRYEFYTAQDPMDPLIAVLRSNYWLSTHVITITLGYSAGLLTSALSHGFITLKLFKLDADKSLEKLLTRMVYGCCCFTLLLSLIGTVLGGIWANDSWGRFWGWDPKENGALMIVLWSLLMLHARLGGYIKAWGLHLLSIIGGCVVAFSWWHVNFLGVGLHSYGFTDGEKMLWYFYAVEVAVIIIGLLVRAKMTHSSTKPSTAN